jgi:membrane-anchored glycerophosphoryl diester phosphodiesterase (GDPDase)
VLDDVAKIRGVRRLHFYTDYFFLIPFNKKTLKKNPVNGIRIPHKLSKPLLI